MVDLLDYELAAAWQRSGARKRALIREVVAAEHRVPVRAVRLVRRRDGRVAAVIGAPREQLDLPFCRR